MALLSAQFAERLAERTKLKGERCVLENALEAEQESIVHRMGVQVQALMADRAQLKRECDRLRGLASRSVSPAMSRGQPSPLASPRVPPDFPPHAPL